MSSSEATAAIAVSCDGMATFCGRIGKGMLCEPGGWCFCKVSAIVGAAGGLRVGAEASGSSASSSAQVR